MKQLEKYTGTKTYMFPSGALATPEMIEANYPAVKAFTHVIETEGEVCYAIINLSSLRSRYNIDSSLTEDEAIAKLQEIANTPVVVDATPTPEERIAAALEYQNLLSM